uniref:Striatin domain-containing protein n=1 Tax=Gongylonema pulchrum TaxID=637853 RepID=A0A183D1F2_9BILA
LRSEVDELRNEVSTLRDTLNEQIVLFADERKRWEEERVKILKSNGVSSARLGGFSTSNDPASTSLLTTGQLSGNMKLMGDGKAYVVSRDRLI